MEQAINQVEHILKHLSVPDQLTDFKRDPFRPYHNIYQVFSSTQDPRADDILAEAHSRLRDSAAKIFNPELRRSFLENVPWHREIVDLRKEKGG